MPALVIPLVSHGNHFPGVYLEVVPAAAMWDLVLPLQPLLPVGRLLAGVVEVLSPQALLVVCPVLVPVAATLGMVLPMLLRLPLLPLLPAVGRRLAGVVEGWSPWALQPVGLLKLVSRGSSSSSSKGWGWRGCLLTLLLIILCWRSNCSSRAWASSNSDSVCDCRLVSVWFNLDVLIVVRS
jgi:hypothetical protein